MVPPGGTDCPTGGQLGDREEGEQVVRQVRAAGEQLRPLPRLTHASDIQLNTEHQFCCAVATQTGLIATVRQSFAVQFVPAKSTPRRHPSTRPPSTVQSEFQRRASLVRSSTYRAVKQTVTSKINQRNTSNGIANTRKNKQRTGNNKNGSGSTNCNRIKMCIFLKDFDHIKLVKNDKILVLRFTFFYLFFIF